MLVCRYREYKCTLLLKKPTLASVLGSQWDVYNVYFSSWLSDSEFNISHMRTLTGLPTSHVAANSTFNDSFKYECNEWHTYWYWLLLGSFVCVVGVSMRDMFYYESDSQPEDFCTHWRHQMSTIVMHIYVHARVPKQCFKTDIFFDDSKYKTKWGAIVIANASSTHVCTELCCLGSYM